MTAMRRAGLLIPSSNTTVEDEYNRFGPEALSWHAGRLSFTIISPEALAAQDAEMVKEAEKLATTQPDILLICQSAVGFALGNEYERDLVRRLRRITGIPVLSLATIMVEALHALGVTRIALAMPFPTSVGNATTAYLTQAGFQVLQSVSLNLNGNFALANVPTEHLSMLVQEADGPDVEAIVLPGGNLRTLAILDSLETAVGKPVVSTNQAGLWAAAGALGLVHRAIGRLSAADPDGTRRRLLLAGARTPTLDRKVD